MCPRWPFNWSKTKLIRSITSVIKGLLVISFSRIHSHVSKMSVSSGVGSVFQDIRDNTRKTLHGTTLIFSPANCDSNGEYPNHQAYKRHPKAHTSVRVSKLIPFGGSYNSGERYAAVQNWAASSVTRSMSFRVSIFWKALRTDPKSVRIGLPLSLIRIFYKIKIQS